ncbi:MAG: 1,4-alpha-glucan branching protein GlgB [Fibrobacterota bacterium]|nr:MAG: 1,4-alpha-glucan branching protein GlgB [Fibrobacterota bacterium]
MLPWKPHGAGVCLAPPFQGAHSVSALQYPVLGSLDIHLHGEGNHERIWEKLGAHPCSYQGVEGVSFAVWAPNARRIAVIGDFNNWHPDAHLMERQEGGVWQCFVAGAQVGQTYKFHLVSQVDNYWVEKSDPYAFAAEYRPGTGSRICDLKFQWHDTDWMAARKSIDPLREPISIYEVHLGSWARVPEDDQRFLNYRELAPKLAKYVKETGFTHVELLPITEHPFDGSWGYQATGYFAPTSRFGSPEDFQFFVDHLHQEGVGVILDWVPAHFPKDFPGLAFFDGTHLYEHADPRQGEHRDWSTLIFNFGRNEVANFLMASALFWMETYHIDGLRVDAVASMLYLDYSRKDGEWVANQYGGRENIDAIEFLRKLNARIHALFPGTFTLAEESTAWPGVSRPTYVGGLGFTFKWDMGWMHDTLSFMSKDSIHRKWHHDHLTFRMLYVWSENFVLPLSHDEVVHMKGSLIGKMPGDWWQKMANLRLLYGNQWGNPGKKLLFMGGEFGQWREWSEARSLDWHLLDFPTHEGLRRWVADLNKIYREMPAMHDQDCAGKGYEWVDCSDSEQSVTSFLRRSADPKEPPVLFVFNYTPIPRHGYRVGVPWGGFWQERLNSDAEIYGGSGMGNMGGREAVGDAWQGQPAHLMLELPPLSCMAFVPLTVPEPAKES